jgi:hypothetical protein
MVSWYALDRVTTWFSIFVWNSRTDSVYTLVEEVFNWGSVLIKTKYEERLFWYYSAQQFEEPNPLGKKRLDIFNKIIILQKEPETNIQSF